MRTLCAYFASPSMVAATAAPATRPAQHLPSPAHIVFIHMATPRVDRSPTVHDVARTEDVGRTWHQLHPAAG